MERAVIHRITARLRRITAGALLFLMLSPTVALAILPLGFGLGLSAGIAESGLAIPIAMGTAALGAIVAMVSFHNSNSTQIASNQAVTAMINPQAEMPKRPAGWLPPSPGSNQPEQPASSTSDSQPSSTVNGWRFKSGSGMWLGEPGATKDAACVTWGPSVGAYYSVMESTVWGECSIRRNSDGGLMGGAYAYPYIFTSCPSGYTLSGSTCTSTVTVPQGPAQKPSDGHCTIVRTGNTFTADPYDTEDCVGAQSEGHITIAGDSKSITATRDDGSRIEVRLQDDGTSVVVDTRPVSASTTKQTSVTMSAPDPVTGDSKVIGTSTQQFQGTGTSVSSTPNSVVDVNLDSTGLASESTQQGIKSTLDGIGAGLTPGVGDDGNLTAQSTALDAAASAHESLFGGSSTTGDHGFTWDWLPSIPASGACVNPSVNIHGHALSIDFCTAAAYTREALSWMVYIFGSIMILNILTARKAT